MAGERTDADDGEILIFKAPGALPAQSLLILFSGWLKACKLDDKSGGRGLILFCAERAFSSLSLHSRA